MSIDENYTIIRIHPNPHIDTQIAEAVRTGHLWVQAVPRENIGGFDSSPFPQFLVFAKHSLMPDEAAKVYDSWVAQHGS